MKLFYILLAFPICLLSFTRPLVADQWGSVAIAHCYDLDDQQYQGHFFVRVFRTEIGGGQLYRNAAGNDGPRYVAALEGDPASCVINEELVRFEVLDFVAALRPGGCGLCEQTGFRLTIDDMTIWESPRPEPRGSPIFNGTIDVDRDMVRICVENMAEDVGVELPYEPDFLRSKTSILICETISH